MKRTHAKLLAIALVMVTVFSMFSACGNDAASEADINEMVNAAVQAAMDSSAAAVSVTVEADGRQITFEDIENKSIQQLLDQADITLNEGDVLSVAPYQTFSGNILVQVLRKSAVTIAVSKSDAEAEVLHTIVLMGGTVADALEAAGVEITEDLQLNYALDQVLKDGMQIVMSGEAEEEAETVPEETKSSSSNKSNSNKNNSNSNSNSGKTVVSVEYYEDCDGSGHGVKVITYSDGSQEEVPY